MRMSNPEKLVVGQTYWHVHNTVLRKLVFMEKVPGRKQYRFIEGRAKRRFVMRPSNVYWMFENYEEAALIMAGILENYARQYRQYAPYNTGTFINGRAGFPRKPDKDAVIVRV